MQMWGLTIWLPLIPFCMVIACVEMNLLQIPRCEHFCFLIQVAFLEIRKWDLRLWFLLNHMNILFLSTRSSFWASLKLILTFTKWGGVACKTTSVHGPHCNFHPWNTTSVYGQELLSTSASPQYLIHCFQHEWVKNTKAQTAKQGDL